MTAVSPLLTRPRSPSQLDPANAKSTVELQQERARHPADAEEEAEAEEPDEAEPAQAEREAPSWQLAGGTASSSMEELQARLKARAQLPRLRSQLTPARS